jgi:hypothetical protein
MRSPISGYGVQFATLHGNRIGWACRTRVPVFGGDTSRMSRWAGIFRRLGEQTDRSYHRAERGDYEMESGPPPVEARKANGFTPSA